MREWINFVAENVVLAINTIVLLTILLGTAQTVFQAIGAILGRPVNQGRLREAYISYGHWLVAALTFQIAADILETSIAPTWQDIGRLAAVSAIRVFLNFFLERDVSRAEQILAQTTAVTGAPP